MLVLGDRPNIGIQPLDKYISVGQPVIVACGKRGVDPGCCSLPDFGKHVTIAQRSAELCDNISAGRRIERAG
jgi:hypothetical protein